MSLRFCLLLSFWPDIVRDEGNEHEVDPHLVGEPARVRYCEGFKASPVFTKTAEKVGIAKWRTWEKNHRHTDKYRHTKCMNLTTHSMKSGFVKSIR